MSILNFFCQSPATRLCALGIISISTWVVPVSAQDEFSVNWSSLSGNQLPKRIEPDLRLSFVADLPEGSMLVDAQSTPANPFKDSAMALYVNAASAEPNWFRLTARPFIESPAQQGLLEFELRLVSGTLTLLLGACNLPWTPTDIASYAMDTSLIAVALSPGNQVQIRGREFRTDSLETLEENQNYTLLVKWEISDGSNATFAFYLNGEQLRQVGGGPTMQVPVKDTNGINVYRISLGTSENHAGAFFLGRIQSATGNIDILSPAGRLQSK